MVDLLALRDGELVDAELQQAIRSDPARALRLRRLEQIREDLESLPGLAPDPALWATIQARAAANSMALAEPAAAAGAQRFRLPYPLATAAAVFLAVVGLSLAIVPSEWQSSSAVGPQLVVGPGAGATTGPGARPGTPEPTLLAPVGDLASLMDRSQSLEAVARLPVVRSADATASSREALLFRIGELDAEINGLIEQESLNPMLKERLWRQRVELLETLLAVQQDQVMKSAELH